MDLARQITELLLDIGAVKVNAEAPFTWASGIVSPVYCDNRKLISHPKERAEVVRGFVKLIGELGEEPEFLGGTATAAIPWASFLANELELPMVYIRSEKKQHGAGRQVEGDLPLGRRVLIVEDLISTGGSSVAAARAVAEECKGVVTDIVAIVTWELEESKTRLREAGLRLHTLTDFSHIAHAALERGVINQQQWEKVLEFKKSPRNWK